MYIKCIKDLDYGNLDMKAGINYPITAIYTESIYFKYPNGMGRSISKHFLKEMKEHIKVMRGKLCKHKPREMVFGMEICTVCDEVISIEGSKLVHL